MAPFTRPALARLAAACTLTPAVTVAAHAPAPVSAEEPTLVLSCTTATLAFEEVEAGATSDVACEWLEPGEWVGSLLRSTVVATHYDGTSGSPPVLTVTGSCNGTIAFAINDPWNNAISSTRHRACGVIKHYDTVLLAGDVLVTTGGPDSLWELGTMSNRTSSVAYIP